MSAPPPSAATLRARVLEAVAREPVAARPQESRRRTLVICLGVAGALVVALTRSALDRALGGAPEFRLRGQGVWHVVSAGGAGTHGQPLGYLVMLVLSWVLVALAATWLGVARGRSMLGRSSSTLLAAAALTPLALALTWFGVAHAQLPALDETPGARLHLHCAVLTLAYSLAPLVAFFAVRRGTAPLNPRRAGAAVGAGAGAWGALLYIASCECSSPVHVAVSHILPVAVLAAVGALAGERVLGLRAINAR